MHNIIIYSTPTCHFCHNAKEFFKENNVQFTDRDAATDVQARNEAINKSGQMGVPVIDIDDTIIVGFDEPKIRQLLGIK